MGKSASRIITRRKAAQGSQRQPPTLQAPGSLIDRHEFLMVLREGQLLAAQEDFRYTDVVIFQCQHCQAVVGERVAALLEAFQARIPYCPVCLKEHTHVFELADGLISLTGSLGEQLKLSLALLPRCAHCEAEGKVHDPYASAWIDHRFIMHSGACELKLLDTDQLAQLDLPWPEALRALPGSERQEQIEVTAQVCTWKEVPEVYFVRAVLSLPVRTLAVPCHLLTWAQVQPEVLQELTARRFHRRGREVPAHLANNLPGLPETQNLPVSLRLVGVGHRPLIILEPAEHPLYGEQTRGITLARLAAYERAHRAQRRTQGPRSREPHERTPQRVPRQD